MLSWGQGILFFSGDVQTTAIAIAITSSLCCSVVWLIVSLVTGDDHSLLHIFRKWRASQRRRESTSKKSAMVSFHLQKRCSLDSRRNSRKFQRSVWSTRHIDEKCSVPCIRCGLKSAEFVCRYVLCQLCCHDDPFAVCEQHGSGKCVTPHSTYGASDKDKPTEIDLSNLHLEVCPDRVGYIGTQLMVLNLSYNKLRVLPPEIGCLLGLRSLSLQHNCIDKLPDSIGNLTRLFELHLHGNHLREIPSTIGQLHNLIELQLTSNLLNELPESIGQLTNLQHLFIESNNLSSLPESIGNLTKLKKLLVSENYDLTSIPESIGSLVRLEVLDLSDCNLPVLPRSITWCSFLRRLCLQDNQLKCLPDQLGRLHQLIELKLHRNQLSYLPASLICLHPLVLSVYGNPFLGEEERDRQEQIAASGSPASKLPSLLEETARYIVQHGVSWCGHQLPRDVEDLLSSVKYCSSCEGPFFNFHRSQLSFHRLLSLEHLPLYQQICSPHRPNTCSLLPLQQ